MGRKICDYDCLNCKYRDCINDSSATVKELRYSDFLDFAILYEVSHVSIRQWVKGGDSENYISKRLEKISYGKEYYASHREARNQYGKEYYQRNKERLKAKRIAKKLAEILPVSPQVSLENGSLKK